MQFFVALLLTGWSSRVSEMAMVLSGREHSACLMVALLLMSSGRRIGEETSEREPSGCLTLRFTEIEVLLANWLVRWVKERSRRIGILRMQGR